jgi:hypothetical protein
LGDNEGIINNLGKWRSLSIFVCYQKSYLKHIDK